MSKIHYIGDEWNSKFIIAETKCGKHWQDVADFTHHKGLVTYKKCLNKINKNDNKVK